jgi:hypothetical protein
MSKETREISERIIAECTDITGRVFPARMASAIDEALRDRDERAAKIAECWLDNRVAKSWNSTQTANGIAAAIRDGVADAK